MGAVPKEYPRNFSIVSIYAQVHIILVCRGMQIYMCVHVVCVHVHTYVDTGVYVHVCIHTYLYMHMIYASYGQQVVGQSKSM